MNIMMYLHAASSAAKSFSTATNKALENVVASMHTQIRPKLLKITLKNITARISKMIPASTINGSPLNKYDKNIEFSITR